MTSSMMNTETQVSPDAETQNPAPETAVTPEVAAPETQVEAPAAELTEAERHQKSIQAMERRLNRKHAQAAAAAERALIAEQRLAQYEAQRPQQSEEAPVVDERAIVEKAREIARVTRVAEQSNTVYASGKKDFPDFDDALQAVIAEAGPLIDKSGLPTALGQVVLEADAPHAVLHYLGNNPDIAAELADLSPTQMARKMARIEADLSAKPKTSAAPTPLKPVKPAAVTNELSSDLPVDEWMKRREKELKAKRGY